MARRKRDLAVEVQPEIQPEEAESLADETAEEVAEATADEPKVRKTAHGDKPETIMVDGVEYMRFAAIAKIMGCAFQQVYQRSHKEKSPMAWVKDGGILYGRVADIETWQADKAERIARKEQRIAEKAAKEAAKAEKEKAAKKAAEASADAETEVEAPDA